jgi:DNA-binding beta-propeller fold protein YncE
VISGSSEAVVANVPLGQQPIAAAFNPVTNVVYVSTTGTGTGSGAIAEVDASSNTLIATVPVSYAVFIAVNPVTNLVYFSNSQWTVSVLDGSTNQIVGTITTGSQCCIEGITVDDATNRIYVTQQVLGRGNVNQLVVINGSTIKLSASL